MIGICIVNKNRWELIWIVVLGDIDVWKMVQYIIDWGWLLAVDILMGYNGGWCKYSAVRLFKMVSSNDESIWVGILCLSGKCCDGICC